MDKLLKLLLDAAALLVAYTSLYLRNVYLEIGTIAYRLFAKKELKRLYLNMQRVLGLSKTTAIGRSFALQCVRHQIVSALDGLTELYAHKPVVIDNMAELDAFIVKYAPPDRGLIIISAHIGCWELVAKYMRLRLGRKLSVLAKPSRQRAVSLFLEGMRKRAGVEVLWNESKSILRDMLGVLKRNEALGFVMDQKPANRVGFRTDFLGLPADFVTGPAAIGMRANVPIVAVYLLRTYGRTYTFRCDAIWDGIEPIEQDALLERMVRSIEGTVRTYPEQWTWSYKRWKFDDIQVS